MPLTTFYCTINWKNEQVNNRHYSYNDYRRTTYRPAGYLEMAQVRYPTKTTFCLSSGMQENHYDRTLIFGTKQTKNPIDTFGYQRKFAIAIFGDGKIEILNIIETFAY